MTGCNTLYQKGYDAGLKNWKTESFDNFYQRETFIYHDSRIALTPEQETVLRQIKQDEWNKIQAMIADEEAGRMTGAEVMKQAIEETRASDKRLKPHLTEKQLATLKSLGHGIE